MQALSFLMWMTPFLKMFSSCFIESVLMFSFFCRCWSFKSEIVCNVLLKAWPQPAWCWRKSGAVLTRPSRPLFIVCVAPPPAAYKSCQKAAPIGSTSDLFLLLLALLTTRSELSWYLLICIVLLIAVVSFLDIYRFVLSVYLLLLSLPLAVNQTPSKDILDS